MRVKLPKIRLNKSKYLYFNIESELNLTAYSECIRLSLQTLDQKTCLPVYHQEVEVWPVHFIMCRNCLLPQWSEPIEVDVASLPTYFSKEQSWNFERLNFGNGTIIDTVDGKGARPSITGRVGCRLRDGFLLKPNPHFPGGRYLLVSEVLYCPGRRYGCTPRSNCTGKRRFCHALCKLSIFADKPSTAFIYYSGSHGTGDVSSSEKHRPNKQMLDELRRLRVEQSITPSQGYEWCKAYFAQHNLDEKTMPTKQQIKSVFKVFIFLSFEDIFPLN